jgi:hypothetical protein
MNAPGFRVLEVEDGALRATFSSFLDPASVFPFYGRGVSALPVESRRAFSVSPNLVAKMVALGFKMKAPVVEGDEFLMAGSVEIAGAKVDFYMVASLFERGFPRVDAHLIVRLDFDVDEHAEFICLANSLIRRGVQLGEFLASDDGKKDILTPREFAGLKGAWLRWSDFYSSMVSSRISPRDDFDSHVRLGHGVELLEVMEALQNQVAESAAESRRDKLDALGASAIRRVNVLGITDAGRVLEVVLESGGGKTVIVTAFTPDGRAKIGWWIARARATSSNERLKKLDLLSEIYSGIKDL